MLWTFYRHGRELHYEIRLPVDGPGYELVIKRPDKTEVTEQFDNMMSLNRRVRDLRQELLAEGWYVAGASHEPSPR
jgi:hypothetical protein